MPPGAYANGRGPAGGGAACVGMLRLLRNLGCEPDLVAGHSYGELVALHAAGVFSAPALAELSLARGRFMQEAGHGARARWRPSWPDLTTWTSSFATLPMCG